jgi:hypothetical protein
VKQQVRPQMFIVNQTMMIIMEHHVLLCGINTGETLGGDRQRTQRERMRYCRFGREGENGASKRIWHGFYIKDSYFGFDR